MRTFFAIEIVCILHSLFKLHAKIYDMYKNNGVLSSKKKDHNRSRIYIHIQMLAKDFSCLTKMNFCVLRLISRRNRTPDKTTMY